MTKNFQEPFHVELWLFQVKHVTPAYLEWMHNPAVTQYLESRWRTYSLEDLISYVRHVNESPRDFLFGIFVEGYGHVGNIKIGEIDWKHRYGDMGLIIGDSSVWGKGVGTRGINLACDYAFQELGLRKIVAGIYEPNVGSRRAFEKAGFVLAGRLAQHRLCQGKYVDQLIMERLASHEQ